MPFTPITWTGEMVSELKRLWPTGMSCEKIGKKLGMSKNAVVGKAGRMGLPKRKIGSPRGLGARQVDLARAKSQQPPTPDIPPPKPLLEVGQWVETDQCKYIYGDPSKEYQFCGHPVADGKPYCEYHDKLCNTPNIIGKVK